MKYDGWQRGYQPWLTFLFGWLIRLASSGDERGWLLRETKDEKPTKIPLLELREWCIVDWHSLPSSKLWGNTVAHKITTLTNIPEATLPSSTHTAPYSINRFQQGKPKAKSNSTNAEHAQCAACKIWGHKKLDCRLVARVYAILEFIKQHPKEAKSNHVMQNSKEINLAVNSAEYDGQDDEADPTSSLRPSSLLAIYTG